MILKLKDYERIYKTINSIILDEKADPTVACTFFGVYGSYILSKHYKIDARPVAGVCLYNLGNSNVLTFGKTESDIIVSNTDGFHCWVLAEGWHIDFMAPAFPDLLKNTGRNFTCKSKMMQKKLAQMASSAGDISTEGDYYFEINPELTNERIQYATSKIAYHDLAEICVQWYKKPPKQMLKAIQIGDGKGNSNTVPLKGKSVIGAW